jgi:flagellar basal body P-ring formation protein FlgA
MIRAELFHTVRQSFEILIGALIMLHLTPFITSAAAAFQQPMSDVRLIDRDVLHLSDVFTDIPQSSDKVLGPAPQPGQDMVLNARTLMKLAIAYGVNWRPASASDQLVIRRDGTVIEPDMIKASLIDALGAKGVSGNFELAFNAPLAPIALHKDARTDMTITRLDYNPARATFTATLTPVSAPTRQIGVSGAIERLIDVPVARNTLARGAMIASGDIETLQIRESLIKADTLVNASDLVGQTPRRVITAGKVIKASDVEIPLSVKRGDKITLLYRLGAMELSAQGRAVQEGRMGDRIKVVNTDSNKPMQGTVSGDNQVEVD